MVLGCCGSCIKGNLPPLMRIPQKYQTIWEVLTDLVFFWNLVEEDLDHIFLQGK